MSIGSEAQVPTSCSFPSGFTVCQDPTGRWIVQFREASRGQSHELLIKNLSNGQLRKILEFQRHADAAWSPGGHALAITDHAGSNESTLWVVTGPNFQRVVNIEDQLRTSLGELPEIYNNGHRYFEAVRWIGTNNLLFRVRAYDSEPGKEYRATFRYQLGGRVRRETDK